MGSGCGSRWGRCGRPLVPVYTRLKVGTGRLRDPDCLEIRTGRLDWKD